MASIERVGERGKDRRYRVRWRTPEGVQRKKTFRLREDAERWARDVEVQKDRGQYVDPAAGRILFREYAEEWRAAQLHWEKSTHRRVGFYFPSHVYPALGDLYLRSIERSTIQAWVKSLVGALAPTTIRTIYGDVVGVFNAAVQDDKLVRSPCRGINLPDVPESKVIPLTPEQVGNWIEATELAGLPRFRAPIILAAGAGPRAAECFALTVDHIDWLRREIKIDRQLALDPQRGQYIKRKLKTPSSYRTIPVSDTVIKALAAHVQQYDPITVPDEDGNPVEGVLFSTHVPYKGEHRPIRPDNLSRSMIRLVEVAGLPSEVAFHALRHFYASLLIGKGCSVKVVQKRLGHKSAKTTLDTYGHLWPDDDASTRDAVEDVLGPVVRDVPETCHDVDDEETGTD